MPTTVAPFLFVGVGLIVLVIFFRWAAQAGRRSHERVGHLASELGLAMEPASTAMGLFISPPRATGLRRGKRTEIYTFTTGSGKSRTTWAALSAQPTADGGLKFKISRQGFGSKIAEFFGTKEIQVGDAAFDAQWFIETNRPDFFAAALLPELRAKLGAAVHGGPRSSFKLEHGKVVYAEVGGFFDEARCRRLAAVADVVGDLADVAEVFATSARG